MRLISQTGFTRAALLCALVAAVGCEDTTEPTTPTTITVGSGSTLTGRAGETKPVSVTVFNQNGKALATTPVTFAVSTGGGSVTPTSTNTDANGQANVTWTLGNTLGSQTLTVTSGAVQQVITATVTAGNAASVSFTAGAGQTATVGNAVATAPAVTVRDAGNNPVSGVQVTFTSTPSGVVTPTTVTTDANGVARVGTWALGPTAGTYTLQAAVLASGVTGNPASITATAVAGAASQVTLGTGIPSTAPVGTALSGTSLPSVVVRDANGNPVTGANVTCTVTAGGGTISGGSAATNAQGSFTVGGFTLGQTAGTNTINCAVPGAGAVTINITGTAAAASAAAVNAGNNQAVGAGLPLQVGPSIIVRDRFGNPVAGVPVTFVVTSGGGSVLGANQTTNAQGIATVGGFTLGTTPGPNTIVARVAGLPDVTFTATGLAGAPASITRVTPESTTVVTNTTQTSPITVLVRDAAGFPVQSTTVTFSVTGGAGTVSQSVVTTNASGQASTTFTGGGVLGPATISASVAGVATPATFTVTVARATPTAVTLVQGANQVGTANNPVPIVPVVKVTDAAGRPVPGVEVQFRISAGQGNVSIPIDTTDANGLADPGTWTLGGQPGLNVLSIIVSEPLVAGNPIQVSATAGAPPTSASLIAVSGNAQTAPAGSVLPQQIAVQVLSGSGQILPGVTVQFLVSGDGTVSPSNFVVTDANGVARVTWKLMSLPGLNTLTALVPGTNAQIQFTATGQ